MISSEDGIHWGKLSESPLKNHNVWSRDIRDFDLIYAKGQFIFVGKENNREYNSLIYSSRDGLHWNKVLEDNTVQLQNAYYVNNLYWVTDEYGTIYTSYDGRQWEKHKPVTNQRINSIIWDGKKYLLLYDKGAIATARDVNKLIDIVIDNKIIDMNMHPIIESGRVLVPVRGTFEALGAEVIGDAENRIINISSK